uniref:Exosome complex component rrp4 n=1 Tax=Anthurium amnicola TaxID=1678845 RepID=A0A1D1XD81_9ARAE
MRDLCSQQLRLSETQRVRLQTALQKLEELSSSSASAAVVVTDIIPVNHEDGVLKGHGTSELDGQVVATLCGVVERVNKLVYVRTLRARYKPEIGDVIVGRVIEVATKHWRLEINFSQDAVLLLSSMNLPDGIQRRRTAIDELNMRSIFEENDVICAEVRGFQHDGSLHLQARSHKYGKLKRGQLLTVTPYLVKRRKQHFHHLERYGVDLIMGCNGFIWVGEHVEAGENAVEEDQENKREENTNANRSLVSLEEEGQPFTPLETRQHICRIANAVRVLSALGFSLSSDVIVETAETSALMDIDIRDMVGAEFYVQTAEREVERRMSLRKKKG